MKSQVKYYFISYFHLNNKDNGHRSATKYLRVNSDNTVQDDVSYFIHNQKNTSEINDIYRQCFETSGLSSFTFNHPISHLKQKYDLYLSGLYNYQQKSQQLEKLRISKQQQREIIGSNLHRSIPLPDNSWKTKKLPFLRSKSASSREDSIPVYYLK